MSHLHPVDGDGTGEPPVTDVEHRVAAGAYAARTVIDRLVTHLYVLAALAALVAAVYVAFGLPAALLAATLLGFLAAATVSSS